MGSSLDPLHQGNQQSQNQCLLYPEYNQQIDCNLIYLNRVHPDRNLKVREQCESNMGRGLRNRNRLGYFCRAHYRGELNLYPIILKLLRHLLLFFLIIFQEFLIIFKVQLEFILFLFPIIKYQLVISFYFRLFLKLILRLHYFHIFS